MGWLVGRLRSEPKAETEAEREIGGRSRSKRREETAVINKGGRTFSQTDKTERAGCQTDKKGDEGEESRLGMRTALTNCHVLYCVSVSPACSSQ